MDDFDDETQALLNDNDNQLDKGVTNHIKKIFDKTIQDEINNEHLAKY